MEHILRNVLMALLEQHDATLHDVLRVFSDAAFRKGVAKSLRDETGRAFLLNEFERFSFGYRADAKVPIQNKVGSFLGDPLLNRILTAPEKDLHIRKIMDQGQVLLVKLSKGHIGEDSSSFLLCSGSGMALGGWLAGILYDHFGTYAPAFAAGIVANAVNLAIVGALVFRQKSSVGWIEA